MSSARRFAGIGLRRKIRGVGAGPWSPLKLGSDLALFAEMEEAQVTLDGGGHTTAILNLGVAGDISGTTGQGARYIPNLAGRPVLSYNRADTQSNFMADHASMSTASWAYSVWLRPRTLAGDMDYYNQWSTLDATTPRTTHRLQSSGKILFLAKDGVANPTGETASVLPAGKWTHVVFAYDAAGATNADKMKVWIDGVPETLVFSGTLPAGLQDSPAQIDFGAFIVSSSNYFDGEMYLPVAVSRTITANETSLLYGYKPPSNPVTAVSSNLALWLNASNRVTLNATDNISQWDDASGNGNHAVQATGASQPTFVYDGGNGYPAVDFEASDPNNLTVPDSVSMSPTAALSYFAWFKPESTGGGNRVLYNKGNTAGQFQIRFLITSAGNPQVLLSANGSTILTFTFDGTVLAGSWSHLSVVYDGSGATDADRLKVFLSGTQQSITSGTGIPASLHDSDQPSFFGSNQLGTEAYDGLMDDVRLYSSALTNETLQAIAAEFDPR